ncbi:TlpA family protein disulfide reductase [Paracrocinitomix mangrovi]|uniref:TlpA family protein disulfide reductase n=1 Tax=Paracrocinitomix mangrovi TaxID=2862509 RepID=UPI001C8D5D5E|nr:TlpA disulfide reductase family protein [Paracrocinitomix mangrovi]UKN02139.1 TlpA family protein disulfide reductase [Paracrocinitomix mangrovi]
MLKQIALLLFIGCTISTSAQETINTDPVGGVYITGQFVGAANQTIYLGNQNMGGVRQPFYSVKADSTGQFKLSYQIPFADYYFLKFENGQILHMILHGNDTLKIYGDVRNVLDISNFIYSEESEAMNQFVSEHAKFKRFQDSLSYVVRVDPLKADEVNAYFQPIAEGFYAKRNKFINTYSNSGAVVVTLNAIDQEKEWTLYTTVVDLLGKSYGSSPTVQNIINQTEARKKELEARKFLEPGNLAKEIALPNTEGDTMRLSDLKGKVVLIDFWASWCRPCRGENPNVVKMYKKYKDDGFTVFSVSMDNSAEKWKAAIEQDGLVWPNHVSDLKGWQCAAGIDYLVKSIPFTVLIDKEGKIIGTNIRGEALQTHLKAIFGH